MTDEQPVKASSGEQKAWSGFAIAGFSFSLIGLIVPYCSIAAVVLSAVGLGSTAKNRKRGRALAAWGLALGILNAVGGAIIGASTAWDAIHDVSSNGSPAESTTGPPVSLLDGTYECVGEDGSVYAVGAVEEGELVGLTAAEAFGAEPPIQETQSDSSYWKKYIKDDSRSWRDYIEHESPAWSVKTDLSWSSLKVVDPHSFSVRIPEAESSSVKRLYSCNRY